MKLSFAQQTLETACGMFNERQQDVMSSNRRAKLVCVRNAIAYVLRQTKGLSYPTIGQFMKRDHTTMMWSVARCERQMQVDADYAERVNLLLADARERLRELDHDIVRIARGVKVEDLPPRIDSQLVCQIAGFSRQALSKRIIAGTMPRPIDRVGAYIFLRDEVLTALGLLRSNPTAEVQPQW